MSIGINVSKRERLEVSPYDRGFTVHSACGDDPRFSYSLYVPDSALAANAKPNLIVSIHGTGRSFSETLKTLGTFARWHNCIVMCPLFPANILGDNNLHGYKYLREQSIRYDLILLAMVDEVARRYRTSFDTFALSGFSGGGHFVHRFLMLHPQRLWAASIGAPGSVTLLDNDNDWWTGIRNVEDIFGRPVDIKAIQQVPIQLVVGEVDLDTSEITHKPGGRYWAPGANSAGATRPERTEALRRSFEGHGIPAHLEIMEGAAHDEGRYADLIQGFFAQTLPTLNRD